MRLTKKQWLSRTIRTALYMPLAILVCSPLLLPYLNDHLNRRSRERVERRYRELVAAGKLEQPKEGFSAVAISSKHGGQPFLVRFWQGDPHRSSTRYLAARRKTPEGAMLWQFQDIQTKEWIY